MKEQARTIYRCDHCAKYMLSKPAMRKHEAACRCFHCAAYVPKSERETEEADRFDGGPILCRNTRMACKRNMLLGADNDASIRSAAPATCQNFVLAEWEWYDGPLVSNAPDVTWQDDDVGYTAAKVQT